MSDYDIQLDVKYPHGTLIDVGAEAAAHEPWFNQTLTQVDDAVVRLGIIEGDFHWHKHDDQDEFFLVLEGRLLIDIEDGETVTLDPNQGFSVAKGVVHRTRAPEGRTVILMVERAGVCRRAMTAAVGSPGRPLRHAAERPGLRSSCDGAGHHAELFMPTDARDASPRGGAARRRRPAPGPPARRRRGRPAPRRRPACAARRR